MVVGTNDSLNYRKGSQLAAFSRYTMGLFGNVRLGDEYDNQVTKVDIVGRGSIGI